MEEKYFVINENGNEIFNGKPSLKDLYQALNCRCVTCVQRKIGAKYYDIWADDEGLLVDSPRINAGSSDNREILCGNLLIANNDGNGEISPLSDDDIENIKEHFRTAFLMEKGVSSVRKILIYTF